MKAVSIPFLEGTYILISDTFYDKYQKILCNTLSKADKYVFDEKKDRLYVNMSISDVSPSRGLISKESLIHYLRDYSFDCTLMNSFKEFSLNEFECWLMLNGYEEV